MEPEQEDINGSQYQSDPGLIRRTVLKSPFFTSSNSRNMEWAHPIFKVVLCMYEALHYDSSINDDCHEDHC